MPDMRIVNGGQNEGPIVAATVRQLARANAIAFVQVNVSGDIVNPGGGGGVGSDVNLNQIGGVSPSVGTGNANTGTLRVAVASDQPVIPTSEQSKIGVHVESGTLGVSGDVRSRQSGAWATSITGDVLLRAGGPTIPVLNQGTLGVQVVGGSIGVQASPSGDFPVRVASITAPVGVSGDVLTKPSAGNTWPVREQGVVGVQVVGGSVGAQVSPSGDFLVRVGAVNSPVGVTGDVLTVPKAGQVWPVSHQGVMGVQIVGSSGIGAAGISGDVSVKPVVGQVFPVSQSGPWSIQGSGDLSIVDGGNRAIKSTVRDYANSNPLAVVLTNASGDTYNDPDKVKFGVPGSGDQYDMRDVAISAVGMNQAFKKSLVIAAHFDDVAPATIDDRNVGPIRMTRFRGLHTNLRDASGDQLGTVTNPIRTDPANLTTQIVAISQTGTNNDVDVISVVPGTGATNLGKAEDAVHASGDTGIQILAVRKDSPTNLVTADGDYAPLQVDDLGGLRISAPNNRAISGALGALNAAITLVGDGLGSVEWEVDTGNLVGTVVFEASLDDTNWFAINAVRIDGTILAANITAFPDRGTLSPTGYSRYRLRVSAYTSGTSNARMEGALSADTVRLGQALPTGANILGYVYTFPVAGQPLQGSSRSDTFTAAGNGTTIDASAFSCKHFGVQVVGTGGSATTWDVRLEGSMDNVNFTTIITHTQVNLDTVVLWSGANHFPALYFRSRVVGLVLPGGVTNIVVYIYGVP